MKQLNKATQQTTFAMFTFAGSSGIGDALIMLKRASIDVKGAVDSGRATQKWAASKRLHDAGVELYVPRRDAPFGKLDHKLVVIDDAIVVAGSFITRRRPTSSTTRTSSCWARRTRTCRRPKAAPSTSTSALAIAQFFRTEIDRIIADLSEPYVPKEV